MNIYHELLTAKEEAFGEVLDRYRRLESVPAGVSGFNDFLVACAPAIAYQFNGTRWLQGRLAATAFLRGLKVLKKMRVKNVEVVGSSERSGGFEYYPKALLFDKGHVNGVLFYCGRRRVQFTTDGMFPFGFWTVSGPKGEYRAGWDLGVVLEEPASVETILHSFDVMIEGDEFLTSEEKALAVGHLCGKTFKTANACRKALVKSLA